MYRDVLVPLDGSTLSERALAHAVPIARRAGAVLHLFLVHEPIARYAVEIAPNRLIDRFEAQQRDREARYLERRAATLRAEGVGAVAEVREGDASVELARRASADVELVVMSTRGRGGAVPGAAGGVACRMIRQSAAPVLLIRPSAGPPPDGVPGHVVAATDGSAAGAAAVAEATRFARVFAARLTLIDTPAGRGGEGVCRAATEMGADLLVVGTHRRGRLKRVVLGSVVDGVVRASRIPVLVTPAAIELTGVGQRSSSRTRPSWAAEAMSMPSRV
jgi:nucleotide-binding universal stress UspA family protein